MQTFCYRIKLKIDSLNNLRQWVIDMNNHSSQVYQSLEQETVFVESVFLDSFNGDDYLIYFIKVVDYDKMKSYSRSSELEIEKIHTAFKKANFDSSQKLELLIDFDRILKVE
jgi:hypothetical protein